jgi:hypothetical protein
VSSFVDAAPKRLSPFVDSISLLTSQLSLGKNQNEWFILFIISGLGDFTFLLQFCGTPVAISVGADER